MNSALEYDDTSTSNRLGRLKGVCADFCNATRNGRLYGKELWENVLKDPEVIEGLETKTLFGEEEMARHLFAVLREFDRDNVDVIYSESFTKEGIGFALMNRLLKAAGSHTVRA